MFTRDKKVKKIQTKLFHRKYSKLCTISELVYTFILRYSLASRAFPKDKYSVVCLEFPMGSKFHFSQWEIHFSQFIFIDKCLKFKEIKYFIHSIKFTLCKFPLFSTVELKLGHSMYFSIHP